jgi:hypothetical protein
MTVPRGVAATSLSLATVLSLAACAESPRAARAEPVDVEPGPGRREIGGRKITLKEVDEKWEQFDSLSAPALRSLHLPESSRRRWSSWGRHPDRFRRRRRANMGVVDAYLAQETAKRAAAGMSDRRGAGLLRPKQGTHRRQVNGRSEEADH